VGQLPLERLNAMSESLTPRPAVAGTEPSLSEVSAWVDNELPLEDWDQLLASDAESDSLLQTWHRYHLIGDALRSSAATGSAHWSVDACSSSSSSVLARDIMARARALEGAAIPAPLKPVSVPAHLLVSSSVPVHRHEAANDGVFRWKMVAGLASVAAVLSVAWGVSGLVPGNQGHDAQLAKAVVPGSVVTAKVAGGALPVVVQPVQPSPVWVATPHGQVLRDPRLEELMQAHRQAGGASALQVPAGFLRNATFDASQR